MTINFRFGAICRLQIILRSYIDRYGPGLNTIQKHQELAELLHKIADGDIQQMGVLIQFLRRSKKL